MKSKARGPAIRSAVIALGIWRVQFKRVSRRCWQNNKFCSLLRPGSLTPGCIALLTTKAISQS